MRVLDEDDLSNVAGTSRPSRRRGGPELAKACYNFTRPQKELLAIANLANSVESIMGMLPHLREETANVRCEEPLRRAPDVPVLDRRARPRGGCRAAAPHRQPLLGIHVPGRQGERLDHLATMYLSDPAGFWRIAERNDAMSADVLTESARSTIPARALSLQATIRSAR